MINNVNYSKNKIGKINNTINGIANTFHVQNYTKVEKMEASEILGQNKKCTVDAALLLDKYYQLKKDQQIKVHKGIDQMLVDNLDEMHKLFSIGEDPTEYSAEK